jgi:hypothetical protein
MAECISGGLEQLQQIASPHANHQQSMATIGRLTHLVDLNLDYTDVGDEGLEMLSGLSKLELLSLDSTNATDVAANRLSDFRQLKELNLYHTLLTEKGYLQVRAAVPECKIIWDPLSSDVKRRRS